MSETPKRLLIACGGTGGHLAPGIALAQRLIKEGHHCELLISSKQVDKRLIQKYPDLTFHGLPAVALKKGVASLFKFAWSQMTSLAFCLKLLSKHRPTAVVGFGGFLTVSAGLAAYLTGTPLFIHEANHRVGRTIRWLARLAHTIYLPPHIEVLPKSIPTRRVRYASMPLRSDLEKLSREEARKELGFPLRGKLLVITGGSQGASVLNRWANDHEDAILEAGIHLLCITGPGNEAGKVRELELPLGQIARSRFISFSDRMNAVYSAADLVVARAGAGTIAELTAFQTPSILLPYPFAADDHQRANASHIERQGGAICLDENHLENLFREIIYTLKSESLGEAMRENLKKAKTEDPLDIIFRDIQNLRHSPTPKAALADENISEKFFEQLSRDGLSPEKIKLTQNEPLGPKTTFGIGGGAAFYAEPTTEAEVSILRRAASRSGMPVFCLGRGSNLLVLDSGFRGLVIRLNHQNWQKIEPLSPSIIQVGAGVRLKALAAQMCRQGFEGFEFMEGIPATVGGALRTNAGAFKNWFFDRIVKIRAIGSNGRTRNYSPRHFQVAYRSVKGLEDLVVVGATLKALSNESSPEEIRKLMESFQCKRGSSQPKEPSAGCVFKNPEGSHAGELIDRCGLKGLSVGGAMVSPVHANFIVNTGAATASDVIKLINLVRQKVYKDTKIALNPEIMLLGAQWNDYLLPLEA